MRFTFGDISKGASGDFYIILCVKFPTSVTILRPAQTVRHRKLTLDGLTVFSESIQKINREPVKKP